MRKIFRFLKTCASKLSTFLLQHAEIIKYRLRAKKLLSANPQPRLSVKQKREIRKFFASYGFGNINTDWHRFYCGNFGEFSSQFIPNTIYYGGLEAILTRKEFAVLKDKNLLDTLFQDVEQPTTVVKNINGFFYAKSKLITESEAIIEIKKHHKLLIKPSIDTGGGRNVRHFTVDSGNSTHDEELLRAMFKTYKKDFLIQEILEQCDFMASFNPSSLNTIRITTYLRPTEVVVLSAMVRMGADGKFTDNISTGGIAVPISSDGSLHEHAFNGIQKHVPKKVDNEALNKLSIPNYEKVKDTVKELHYKVPYFKVISWDIALDKTVRPVLIEMNVFGQGIDHQAQIGPWFGKYTREVLAMVKETK